MSSFRYEYNIFKYGTYGKKYAIYILYTGNKNEKLDSKSFPNEIRSDYTRLIENKYLFMDE